MQPSDSRSAKPISEINRVLLFASYYDLSNLIKLLTELVVHLRKTDSILILDDSGDEHFLLFKSKIEEVSLDSGIRIEFSVSSIKSGRGGAILRGIRYVLENYPEVDFILEADSDGSHRSQDILKLLNFPTTDFLIGSRYLPQSKIEGWPQSRRAMSALLNKTIPRLLSIHCTDITNGLRRYSVGAARLLDAAGQSQTGFIYLSEQALICRQAGFTIEETPIHFLNRESGKSTVGPSEVLNALKGLFQILTNRSN